MRSDRRTSAQCYNGRMSQAQNGLVAACLFSILFTASPVSAQPAPQPPPYPPRYAPRPAPAPKPPPVVYGWDPEAPAPDGYEVVDSPNGALIGTGIAMLSIGWTTSIVAGAIGAEAEANEEADEIDAFTPTDWAPLYVPIGGPIAAIVTLKPSPGGLGLLLADTLVQVAGVFGIIAGILDRETRVVRTDYGVELDLPTLTPGGAHVTGRF